MRIALLSSFYFPITGGPSTDTFNLAKTLIDLDHDVTIFTPFFYSPNLDHNKDNIEVIRIAASNSLINKGIYFLKHPTFSRLIKSKTWNGFHYKLSELLKKRDYDVIHSRGISCHVPEINNKKQIIRVMTFGTMPTIGKNYIYKKLMNFSLSEINYKVAIWEGLKEPLWKLNGIKIDKVITNGINPRFFSPIPKNCNDEFVIGTALKFAYENKVKGLKILLHSFSKLSKQIKNVKLKIAGDGPLRDKVEKSINELNQNARNRVTLLGELSYFDMPNFYNSLDLYAHISFQDASPNAVLEAMSCGLPVIANSIGIIPQVIDEDIGWIVRPKVNKIFYKLATIIELDPQILRKKGKKARNKVKNNFSWKRTALQYLKLYEDHK